MRTHTSLRTRGPVSRAMLNACFVLSSNVSKVSFIWCVWMLVRGRLR
jgi:hypothetical protein